MTTPMMTREEFIDSLYTEERRDDAYKLWDWLVEDPTRLIAVNLAYYIQATYQDSYGWQDLASRWARILHFTSEKEEWSSLVAMITGGVAAKVGWV